MKNIFRLIVILIFLLCTSCLHRKRIVIKDLYEKLHAEINGDNAPIDTVNKPSLEFTQKKAKADEIREKRIGKKTFYGFKTNRAFTRKGKDPKRLEYEIFFVLRKWQDPNPYIKDIYWFHKKKRAIFIGKIEEEDKPYAKLLHGPYMRRLGKILIEEGIYYVGAKHGRWVKYDKNYILLDKRKFYKGYPTEAEISYYDTEKKRPKEIIPILFGKKDGDYFYYSPNGDLLTSGFYKEDVKIGVWLEYYPNKKKKKETQYPKDPYVKDFETFIIKEYNEKGKVIYDYRKNSNKSDSSAIKK